MPSEESILLTHIENTVGRLTNLPDSSSRSTVIAKLKEILLKIGNVPILDIFQGSTSPNETITLTPNDLDPFALSSDGTNLYVGTGIGQITQPGQIIQIDLETFSRVTSLSLDNNNGEHQVDFLIQDPRYLYAAVINFSGGGLPCNIVRIDKLLGMGLQRVDAINLPDILAPTGMATDGTFLYVCSDLPDARIVKIDISINLSTGIQNFTRVGDITFPLSAGISDIFVDGTYIYANTIDSPGQIHKVDISTFTEVLPFITLPFDSGGTYVDGNILYVGKFTIPPGMMKVDLDSFTFSDYFNFTTGALSSPGLFSDGSLLYITDFNIPTHLFKIDISTFREFAIDTIPGATGGQLTIDQRFIYICQRSTPTTPATVLRRFLYPTTNAIDRHIVHIFDQTSTGLTFLHPSHSIGITLTSGAGVFTDGAYSDVIPTNTVTSEFFLYAIFLDKTTASKQFEVDIAIGAPGSEQVIATVSHEVSNSNDSREYQIQPPIDISSNSRISARCRDETGGNSVNIKVRYKINKFI